MDRFKMPVLGLYGEADPGIPAADVRRFEAELKKRNPSVELVLYPGAQHAFFNDTSADRYHAEAAKDAWALTLKFLRARLAG